MDNDEIANIVIWTDCDVLETEHGHGIAPCGDPDSRQAYREMFRLSRQSAQRYLQGNWTAMVFDTPRASREEIFRENWRQIRDIWHSRPCNILYLDSDTLFCRPTEIFGRFREFRLFNWTDPKNDTRFTNTFNAGVRYYPNTMDPGIWQRGDVLARDWDMTIWDQEQIIFNEMFWQQALEWSDAHRPEMNFQMFWPQALNHVSWAEAWNTISLDQAHVIHYHGSRGAVDQLQLGKQLALRFGIEPNVMETKSSAQISVLLPTRKRTAALDRAVRSLIANAQDPSTVEILLAWDQDDESSRREFEGTTGQWLTDQGTAWRAYEFQPLGYQRLHQYVNHLSRQSQAQWVMLFNDDAVMETPGWDSVVRSYTGQFRLLRATTNLEHPYAIFPILPRAWIDVLGHFSQHQLNDAWVSQIGWLLDIVETIPVHICHERADLTGANDDETYRNRVYLEGNPDDPRDFNSAHWRAQRQIETDRLAQWLEGQGHELRRYRRVLQGLEKPWQRMAELDVRGQMTFGTV